MHIPIPSSLSIQKRVSSSLSSRSSLQFNYPSFQIIVSPQYFSIMSWILFISINYHSYHLNNPSHLHILRYIFIDLLSPTCSSTFHHHLLLLLLSHHHFFCVYPSISSLDIHPSPSRLHLIQSTHLNHIMHFLPSIMCKEKLNDNKTNRQKNPRAARLSIN